MKYISALSLLFVVSTQVHTMQLFKQVANRVQVKTNSISVQKMHTSPSSQPTSNKSCPLPLFLSGCSLILSGYAFQMAYHTKMVTYQTLQDVRFKTFVLTSKDGGPNPLDK